MEITEALMFICMRLNLTMTPRKQQMQKWSELEDVNANETLRSAIRKCRSYQSLS